MKTGNYLIGHTGVVHKLEGENSYEYYRCGIHCDEDYDQRTNGPVTCKNCLRVMHSNTTKPKTLPTFDKYRGGGVILNKYTTQCNILHCCREKSLYHKVCDYIYNNYEVIISNGEIVAAQNMGNR